MSLHAYEVRHGNAAVVLREMPADSVHCCVTSPPYWGLRDYGLPPTKWGDGWVGCLGLEPTPDLFVAHMVEVFAEVRRVLRPDGTCWVNLGDCYASGAGKVGESPGGGEQGARWRGDVDRIRDDKRGYRGDRLANGRGEHSGEVQRKKTRATRDGSHAGKHTGMAALGPMTQPNRMPTPGLKPKDLVGIPWRVAFALQATGWWLRADIIWAKPNPMPESVRDRPTKSHEYLFLLSKSEKYFYDSAAVREDCVSGDISGAGPEYQPPGGGPPHKGLRNRAGNKVRTYGDERGRTGSHLGAGVPWEDSDGKRNRRSVWTVATRPFPEAHFATFPPDLVEPCILAGSPTGGVVLDPFNGSGTTGAVALARGRSYVGIELNPTYVAMSERRLHQVAPLLARRRNPLEAP